MKKMMATLVILIAASTITVNASSKHDNNGRHNNDNVAMMNNDYDRHNDGDRVYNGGRHHRGNKVIIINNYGRRDRDYYMVRREPPRARFAHHAHPFIYLSAIASAKCHVEHAESIAIITHTMFMKDMNLTQSLPLQVSSSRQ